MDIFGVPVQALMAQLMIGLVNGCFYAVLSLGLAVIFGMLHVINFTHGAMFMLGALLSWAGLYYFELNYWVMLFLAPLVVGVFGIVLERLFLKRIYKLDYLYGLLLTLGLTLIIEGAVRSVYGVSGKPYGPAPISGVTDLGFLMIPNYRLWVIVASLLVCAATWYTIERTRLGAYLRAKLEATRASLAVGDSSGATPVERVAVIFDTLATDIEEGRFDGCPFAKAAVEVPTNGAAMAVVREHHDVVVGHLTDITADADTAETIAMIYDGAIIAAKATGTEEAMKLIAPIEAEVRKLLGRHVFAEDDETMEDAVGRLLSQAGMSIAVYEDLTDEERAVIERVAGYEAPEEADEGQEEVGVLGL